MSIEYPVDRTRNFLKSTILEGPVAFIQQKARDIKTQKL